MKKENQNLQQSGGVLETWYLECDVNDSIASIKEAIEKLTSINTSNQKLIFNGKQLEDFHTLSEYEVESETIKLVQLGKETQTLGDLKVTSQTVIYLNTNTENKKPQLLVENTHFGAKGEKMKAELYVQREPTFSLSKFISS